MFVRRTSPLGDHAFPAFATRAFPRRIAIETFDSPYAYTRLGRVDERADLPQALGRRGVRVVFSRD